MANSKYRLYVQVVIDIQAEDPDDAVDRFVDKTRKAMNGGIGLLKKLEVVACNKIVPEKLLVTQEHANDWWEKCTSQELEIALMCVSPGMMFSEVVRAYHKSHPWRTDPKSIADDILRMIRKGIMKEVIKH